MAKVKTALLTAIGLLLLVLGLPTAVLVWLPFLFLLVGSVGIPLVGLLLLLLCFLSEGTGECWYVEGLVPFFMTALEKAMKYTLGWIDFFSLVDRAEHPLLTVILGGFLFMGGVWILYAVSSSNSPEHSSLH